MGYAEHRSIIIQIGGGLDILKGERKMIKLEHLVLASPEQMEFIIEGMRNPMNSWEKSDSSCGEPTRCTNVKWSDDYFLGTNGSKSFHILN